MKQTGPEMIARLVSQDVQRVKNQAAIVFEIEEGKIRFSRNENPLLDIIAVIGPGWYSETKFNEAILLEIGIGKSRPYHLARRPGNLRKNGESSYLPPRRKWFSLSQEQYCQIAPIIFKTLKELSLEQIQGRECNSSNPFYAPTSRLYWSRHQKSLFENENKIPCRPHTRFAVSLQDQFLISDVYCAEINLNRPLRNQLAGLANFIDLYLAPYKNGFKRSFLTLKRVKNVQKRINHAWFCRPSHLRLHLLNFLSKKDKNPLWPYLTSHLIPWDGQPTAEIRLIERVLDNPQSRLGDIQLKVTTGLDGANDYRLDPIKRDHIVFAVYPT
jgi:hypothetical protein